MTISKYLLIQIQKMYKRLKNLKQKIEAVEEETGSEVDTDEVEETSDVEDVARRIQNL